MAYSDDEAFQRLLSLRKIELPSLLGYFSTNKYIYNNTKIETQIFLPVSSPPVFTPEIMATYYGFVSIEEFKQFGQEKLGK